MLNDRRTLSSVIFSFVLGTFFVLLNFGSPFTIAFSLIFYVPAIITIARSVRQGKRFEFYADSFRLTERGGASREIPYSDISKVDAYASRSGRIALTLRGSSEQIAIPGNPVNGNLHTDLFSFLKQKTAGSSRTAPSEQSETNVDETSSTDSGSFPIG
jgi:hypothetical protein